MTKPTFEAEPIPPKDFNNDKFIHFRGMEVALDAEGSPILSRRPETSELIDFPLYIGKINGLACWAADLTDNDVQQNEHGESFTPLRPQFALLPEPVVQALSRGRHLLSWNRRSRFCQSCGAETVPHPDETARLCGKCQAVHYPVIAPAVITAVFQGDKILLAHNRNFREGLHSLIAGFVDPGESLEQTVAREIKEEVGLDVHSIRYVASQSWPFPSSLMLAFTAQCDEGEPIPDQVEIIEANWFSKDDLPDIPSAGSVSRILIDRFIAEGPF